MPVCKTLLILYFPLFSLSFPISSLDATLEYDDAQAILSGADDYVTPTTITGDSLSSSVANGLTSSNPPPVTTISFAPEANPTLPLPQNNGDSSSFRSSAGPIVAAYFTDWTTSQLSPEMVDFDRLDWVDFAFAVPDPITFTPKFSDDHTDDILSRLVAAAHAKDKHVKLSIGGWTGSAHISDAVSGENRDKFAEDIVALYHKFNLDGIDIDWEYPGEAGAAGNTYSPLDSANLLAFLQLLRSLLPKDARITAATQVWPFTDSGGIHMRDVSPFAKVLDWILLMNYDVWDSSPNPGPNAPLGDFCHNSTQSEANAHAAVKSWTTAGFPANQILLGLPAYGYISRSTATSLRTRSADLELSGFMVAYNGSETQSRTASAANAIRNVTVASEAGSADSGQVQFASLVTQGALVKNAEGASPLFVGSGGFKREWDACSSTPFLRSSATRQIVTYDDPESLALKATFVKQAGLLGVNMWDAHGDTRDWDLIDGIRRGLGVN